MTSSDLPKLWTEQTKIGRILENKVLQKSNFSNNFIYKTWSSSQTVSNILHRKKSERFGWFFMPKNDFESTNFANFEEVVHNFGSSDDDMI